VKLQSVSTRLHGATSQKTAIFIAISDRNVSSIHVICVHCRQVQSLEQSVASDVRLILTILQQQNAVRSSESSGSSMMPDYREVRSETPLIIMTMFLAPSEWLIMKTIHQISLDFGTNGICTRWMNFNPYRSIRTPHVTWRWNQIDFSRKRLIIQNIAWWLISGLTVDSPPSVIHYCQHTKQKTKLKCKFKLIWPFCCCTVSPRLSWLNGAQCRLLNLCYLFRRTL
jgi:hypothetical protein